MPRPTLPPTPASSTDIKGQDGSKNLASLQVAFELELPPPALTQDASRISPTDTRTSLNSSRNNTNFQPISPSKATTPYPVQPSETVKSRRRSSAAKKTANEDKFALPPPPTRSRKIIQMKPRPQEEPAEEEEDTAPTAGAAAKSGSAKGGAAAGTAAASTSAQGKKKQPSATSAAGRKIARKTAHSLIERRRRSKMNEEFAVLKGMIPACTGEMHKLAILQASIEYVRYLEDCVAKLKAQRDASEGVSPTASGLQTPSGRDPWGTIPQFVPKYQQEADDVEMTDSEAPSPTFPAQQHPHQHQPLQPHQQPDYPSRSQQPSVSPSPALLAQDSRHRHDSYSSVSTDHARHYSYSSATTSPAFGPQTYPYAGHGGLASGSLSALTSPALAPQRDLDQEATAALLMLNNDRRGAGDGGAAAARGAGRGMSVRDLLST
ncbi:helix-loop-helix DNA-binding domain-containing protein [Colletotrichum karsti]|uniref:Helix-loop-helix DNA-binding domain-containing protein n=1 Tax=Colletotrichum karsti TaxID=1095194 RepID=A0A9P6LHM4_9PEZI|nr:helix-loop-helix DNA-binding domain-containing protein [Colletotrichum karsti]KAF9876434.1 helix-loop-helix DNA-binding domain-containing protein [Colletotrichum karsti]